MANYIILAFCLLIVLSYVFDITSQYTKIPGVIFLMFLGTGLQLIIKPMGFNIPDLKPVLTILGTLGLIMIVMEATLDVRLKNEGKKLITRSVSLAFFLFLFSALILSAYFVLVTGNKIYDSILNAIPFSIISSSVAISSSYNLKTTDKEFVIYESSFSDIFGIMLFDFLLLQNGSITKSVLGFIVGGLVTVLIAVVVTAVLALLLYKINYHINYIIILTGMVLVYSIAEVIHLPALILIIVFGLVLSNNHLFERGFIRKRVDFEKFRDDVGSFKKILHELTFLVRSFFFIIFGFYIIIHGLLEFQTIMNGIAITAFIFLLRFLFLRFILRMDAAPLVFFAPRGLVNILLFISIPGELRLPFLSEEVFSIVILLTIIIMMTGNIFYSKAGRT